MKRNLIHFFKGVNCLSVFLLLLICLIPIVYKEALSEDGFSLSRIISSVLYTLPVCFLLACIKKKRVFVVLSSILMVVSFFETIMVVLYKNFLIAGNIISALNTTADEGSGFVMSSLHALCLCFWFSDCWFGNIRSHKSWLLTCYAQLRLLFCQSYF